MGTAIESIVAGLDGTVSSESVKLALLSFASSSLFLREPEGVQLSEQKLSLRSDIHSPSGVVDLLRSSARQKLESILLSGVKEDVLQLILPKII